ncbi:MAG: hypothetical protein ACREL5_14755, partial [Gemmatimonadales bacterium]
MPVGFVAGVPRRATARISVAGLLMGIALAAPAAAQQNCPALHGGTLPRAYSGGSTVAAITPCDLMTRIYQFADDSFLGRAVGTESNNRATAYIEREARRIGLLPGCERGSYF